MADPKPPHHDRSPDEISRRDQQPEIIDAEVVDEVTDEPSRPRSSPQDDESFRQYQQFLEFQKFQEWQRGQAGGDLPPEGTSGTNPRGHTPWWKRLLRLLRFKFVRRVLYLLLIMLLINWAIGYYFGSSDGGSGNNGTGGSPPQATPITATNPKAAIRAVYNYIAHKPETTCALFDDSGKAAFAYAYGTPSCDAAARQANEDVTDPGGYASPGFGPDALQETPDKVIVDSCAADIQGGPPLGRFQLGRGADGGWIIENYEAPKC
ncbi:hypothetical protein [Parasphingorhabdus pacifica]